MSSVVGNNADVLPGAMMKQVGLARMRKAQLFKPNRF
jgi:hypothetical protein